MRPLKERHIITTCWRLARILFGIKMNETMRSEGWLIERVLIVVKANRKAGINDLTLEREAH